MIYKVFLNSLEFCIKASNLSITGNREGTIACSKRGDERVLSRATPTYGQVNERQFKLSKSIRSGITNKVVTRIKKGSLLYIVVKTLGIPGDLRRISAIKERTNLNVGYRGCICKNSGYSKFGNEYEYGGFVVAASAFALIRRYQNTLKAKEISLRKLFSSIPSGLERLRQLQNLNMQDHFYVNNKIIDLIASEEILQVAYIKIKSKSENITKGVDQLTLDGINLVWFSNLSKELKSGTYKIASVKRRIVLKDSVNVRSFDVFLSKDKIVQEAVRIVLNSIYDPSFKDTSYGFRPKRGCHAALKKIKLTFSNTRWFIKKDSTKSFDPINHHTLESILKRRIQDKGFLCLYWKLVKAGYVFNCIYSGTNNVILQDFILRPLLNNIYLHELDAWIEKQQEALVCENYCRFNLEYICLTCKKGNAEHVCDIEMPSKNLINPPFKRLRYIRYANSFLIGIIGSKAEAKTFIEKLKIFLIDELKLQLNVLKTKVTRAIKNNVMFLGVNIRIMSISGFQIKKNKKIKVAKGFSLAQLRLPLKKTVERLESKGFLHKTCHIPVKMAWLIPFPEEYIVKYFSRIYKKIENYYSCVDNRSLMQRIYYILKMSCALTLASKLKLRTKHKIFSKFGNKLLILKNGKMVASFIDYKQQT